MFTSALSLPLPQLKALGDQIEDLHEEKQQAVKVCFY